MKQRINIKPLSINSCYKGQRFRNRNYNIYEREAVLLLKPIKLPAAPYELCLTFGMSKLSDWDNPIKPIQDILQKKYGFNDRDVMRGIVNKVIVEKGKEFIDIEIKTWLS